MTADRLDQLPIVGCESPQTQLSVVDPMRTGLTADNRQLTTSVISERRIPCQNVNES